MKVISVAIENADLGLKPLGDRLYDLTSPINVRIELEGGLVLLYSFTTNFISNLRSGSALLDAVTDQIGDALTALAYLVHDANYTPCNYIFGKHPLPKNEADLLLREMLRYAGMGKLKAQLIYDAVRLFGHSAYYDDDDLTPRNRTAFTFYKQVV